MEKLHLQPCLQHKEMINHHFQMTQFMHMDQQAHKDCLRFSQEERMVQKVVFFIKYMSLMNY